MPDAPKTEKTWVLRFEVTANADQLQALKAFLIENKINFTKI